MGATNTYTVTPAACNYHELANHVLPVRNFPILELIVSTYAHSVLCLCTRVTVCAYTYTYSGNVFVRDSKYNDDTQLQCS